MRTHLVVLITLFAGIAGCVGDDESTEPWDGDQMVRDACSMGVCRPGAGLEEVNLQPGSAVALTFSGDSSVSALAATESGWGWIRSTTDGLFVEQYNDITGHLYRYQLPADMVTPQDGLLWADDTLWTTYAPASARIDGTLLAWQPGESVREWPLTRVPFPISPTYVSDDVVLLATGGLLTQVRLVDRQSGTVTQPPLPEGSVVGAALDDNLLLVAINGPSRLVMQSLDGLDTHNLWQDDDKPITGVWADENSLGFSVTNPVAEGNILWTGDRYSLATNSSGLIGRNPIFAGDIIHFETPQDGASTLLRSWILTVDGVTDGFFLGPIGIWDANEHGVWWLEVPKADYRFDETANPTEFAMVLMRPS